MKLRQHQAEMTEICKRILGGEVITRIYAAVTPGGGKSMLPVILSHYLIPEKYDGIAWITPRLALQSQAETAFQDTRIRGLFGHSHEIRQSTNEINPARELSGFSTTYQAVLANPFALLHEFERRKYILFLDEPHHIEINSPLHRAIAPLVEKAGLVIFASGTFERGGKEPIAFINYQPGFGNELLVDFSDGIEINYSRRDALREEAICQLEFSLADGWTRYMDDGSNVIITDSLEDKKSLWVALSTEFSESVLESCAQAWMDHKRYVYPLAKMLVVAPNIALAKRYAKFLKNGGIDCTIATSNDSKQAADNIDKFKQTEGYKQDCLVTVAMAYEGLDVPEITHMACLTYYRSKPWLEQCFARTCRKADGKIHGVIYAPDDPDLVRIVELIREEQRAVAKERQALDVLGQRKTVKDNFEIVPLDSGSTGTRSLDLTGETLTKEETVTILKAMEKHGVKGVGPLAIKKILDEIGRDIQIDSIVSGRVNITNLPPSKREKALRQQLSNHVRQYVLQNDEIEFSDINYLIKCEWGARDQMTEAQLKQAWQWVKQNFPLGRKDHENYTA